MKSGPTLAAKIVLLTLVNLVLLGVVFTIFVRSQLQAEFESFLMTTARERVLAVSRQLALELQEMPQPSWNDLLAQYSETYKVTFLLVDPRGQILAGPAMEFPAEVRERLERPFRAGARMPSRPIDRPLPPVGPPFLVTSDGPVEYWVGARLLIRQEDSFRLGTLLIASRTFLTNPFFFQIEPWLAVAAVSLLVSLLCWLPMVRGLTSSIRQMMQATSRIAEGRFDIQVRAERSDELGSLGRSINRMAQQLGSYVHGQKRFLGDIAHELRSPLGRMQLVLGILERRASEQDAPHLTDLREEVETMTRLTDELLAFAKAELKPEAIKLGPVDVAASVEEARRQEAGDGSDVRVNVPPDLHVMANQEYLVRSIANLLRNAIRYAGEAGPIQVDARREQGEVAISVSDSGPGVPEEAIDKIANPFYRLESSRDRRKGGTGLGLAIVRSAVEACRGSLVLRNRKPSGLEAIIRLPAA